MAAPTEDEIQTQINQLIWILEKTLLGLTTNTAHFSGEYDEFVTSDLKGDFAPFALRGLDDLRALMSSTVDPAVAANMLNPLLLEYAKQQGFPETDPIAIWDRIFTYFAEGSERVTSRVFTYPTPSNDGGNTGDGVLNRLTVDRYGYAIENATPELKTFRCVRDRNSGSNVHQELFEIRGTDAPRDYVAGIVGDERVGQIASISADDSQAIVQNPSFNQYDGTAAVPTDITNWTETTSINNFVVVTTDTYRTAVHESTTPASLRFEDNDKITQDLSVVRPTLNSRVPYYCQIAFKRENSCDGNLNIRVGSQTTTVALSAQSGWTLLKMTVDEGLFLRGFNTTTLDIEVELDSRTTGELLVDDLVIAPMTRFDGLWYALVGGATPALLEDKITFTDSISTDTMLQRWLWRIWNIYLPHDTVASANVTWVDPT